MSNRPQGIKNIIAVASGKGGVGKSTVAMNLAVTLGSLGHKVGLLDADIYGPSQPQMMGLTDRKPESEDGKIITPASNHGVKCMSMGFLVEGDTPVMWRGPMIQSAIDQMLNQTQWGQLDYLVIDMPPGTGDAQIFISQKVQPDGAVIVSTPQDVALLDAAKGLNMFKKLNVPVLGMVENMSLFVCPECGHEAHIFGHGGARKKAESIGVDLLAEIPLDVDTRLKTDEGQPVVISMPDSKQAGVMRILAKNVVKALEQKQTQAKKPTKVVIEAADSLSA